MAKKKTILYIAVGTVLGNYWGGGKGSYASTKITGKTKDEVLEKAKASLKDGSLDSGMGYESLIGARLILTKVTSIEIDGKLFENKEEEIEFVGNLSEEEINFLEEVSQYC